MRARTLIAVFLAPALATLCAPTPLAAQATTPALSGTLEPIAVGPAHQISGRIACNGVSYTSDDLEGTSSIQFFDFATNATQLVPGNGLDRLSDTDGRRVAFTQLEGSGDTVLLYDLASQVTTRIPGGPHTNPRMGGNLVAFEHRTFGVAASEIEVYDQRTGTVSQLTNDALVNQGPAVSPAGDVVVWEKCQADMTGCDVYAATRSDTGAFTTRLLTGAGEDRSPDTNGELVVYASNKSGDNDIYFQRAGGSSEMHLAMPGEQIEPHISGNLIVFLSRTDGDYDVLLYDLRTAQLYQVTSTPEREQYPDVIAGCDGTNRVVYSTVGGNFDVYEFSFQLTDSIIDDLDGLIALVRSFNLHDGTETNLISKLQDALAAVNASDTATACDALTAFINGSQAQSGKKLTAGQATQLIDSAMQVKGDLGCY